MKMGIHAAASVLAAVLILAAQPAQGDDAAITPAQSRLGMNLSGPADWSTEYAFVDVFRLSRKWISQRKGAPWGKGPELERDDNGWVKRLDPDCWADTPMLTEGHAPGGQYVCLYEGEGVIEFKVGGRVISRQPGRIVVDVNGKKGRLFLSLMKTNPENYVRNIHFIMPGFEQTYKTEPFYPPFLQRWREFNTFRFVHWMKTDDLSIGAWEERPTPTYCNFTERGVPLEVMVDLCNRLKIAPWFCMPHAATDDYVRRFAAQVKAALDPTLKVYLEYSNEVWNNIFQQHHYAMEKAKELRLGPNERPWEGAAMFYARRAQEIFKIWEEAFGRRDRLVRVIAWQAASGPYWTDKMLLSYKDTAKHADALAIAPYITMCIGPRSTPDVETVAQWSVDQVLDYAQNHALPQSIGWMKTQKAVADKYGLPMIAYEAGQHLVGVHGGENNEAMNRLFFAANRSPRMGAIYTKYLDAWRDIGGGLMCIFASTCKWSKWGSWGVTEYLDETESDQPKFKAVMEWNRKNAKP